MHEKFLQCGVCLWSHDLKILLDNCEYISETVQDTFMPWKSNRKLYVAY